MNQPANYPRVTHIISEILLPENYFSGRDTKKGEYVHLAIDFFEKRVLDEKSLDERLRAYLDQYVLWKMENKVDVLLSEYEITDSVYGITGHIDLLAKIEDERYIIDVKTGNNDDWHIIQLAAYQMIYREPVKVANLYLKPFGHKFVVYGADDARRAWELFKSALSVFNYKKSKKGVKDGRKEFATEFD